MAWGKPSANPAATASELVAKAQTSGSLVVLPMRSFGGSEMAALCSLLIGNSTVSELKASGKTIGTDGARALGELLASGQCGIRRLAVGDTTFGSGGGLQEVRVVLESPNASQCPLEALDLSFKGLQPSTAEDVAAVLAHCPSLRELDLSRNPLGAMGLVSALARPASASSTRMALSKLVISETDIDGSAIVALADDVAADRDGPLRALHSLQISRNPAIGDCASVGRLLSSLPTVQEFHAQGCGLGASAGAALGPALTAAKHLRELKLNDNPSLFGNPADSMTAVGGDAPNAPKTPKAAVDTDADLGAELPTAFIHSSIPSRAEYEASLCLSRAQRLALERQAAAMPCTTPYSSLVTGLATSSRLEDVSLGGCGLSDAIAIALGRECRRAAGSPHIVRLDCRSCKLGAMGAEALLRMPGMVHLELFDNPEIGKDADQGGAGIESLAESLGMAKALGHLDLGACALSAEGFGALSCAIQGAKGSSLRCLELFGNGDQHSVPAWKKALDDLRAACPQLDIAWKEPAN